MRNRYLVAVATVAICGVVAPLVVNGITQAASATSEDGAQQPGPAAQHCVVYPDTTPRQCFDTYRQAIAYASNGEITDAPLDAAAAMSDQRFLGQMEALAARVPAPQTPADQPPAAQTPAAKAPAAAGSAASTLDEPGPSWVIGATLFAGTSYTGNSATLYVPKPCAKDGWYDRYYSDLNVSGDIESLQAWAGCWVWLHDSQDWNGNRMGPYKEQTPDLGDWKNRAVMVGLS